MKHINSWFTQVSIHQRLTICIVLLCFFSASGYANGHHGENKEWRLGSKEDAAWTLSDTIAPAIALQALPNQLIGPFLDFPSVARIVDSVPGHNSGVDTVANPPILYFRRLRAGNVPTEWHEVVNPTIAGGAVYSFRLPATQFPVPIKGQDTIEYFVAAQDLAVPPNVALSGNTVAANPPTGVELTAIHFPVAGSFHRFVMTTNPLSGMVTVCPSGCDYPNLSRNNGLFYALNVHGLSGNLSIAIAGDITNETGQIALEQWLNWPATSQFSVAIYPKDQPRSISGQSSLANSGLLTFIGGKNIRIHGGINGVGSGRNLTLAVKPGATANTTLMAVGNFSGNNPEVRQFHLSNVVFKGDADTLYEHTGFRVRQDGLLELEVENNTFLRLQTGLDLGNTIGSALPLQDLRLENNDFGNDSLPIRNTAIAISHVQDAVVSQNRIHHVAARYGYAKGIFIESSKAVEVVGNSVQNVSAISQGATPSISGIELADAPEGNGILVANNVVRNIWGPGSNSVLSGSTLAGIRLGSSSFESMHGVRVYHNTVQMGNFDYAADSDGEISAAFMHSEGARKLDLRNNIFINQLTDVDKSGVANYALISPTNLGFAHFNNNLLYSSGPEAKLASWDQMDMADLKTLRSESGMMAQGIAGPVMFADTLLRIASGATATALESGGQLIGGYSLPDRDGFARPKPSPSQGGGRAPDLGAYEFDRALLDTLPPSIVYTPFAKQAAGPGPLVLESFATITDPSLVRIAPGKKPRLYYKKQSSANDSTGWAFAEATNSSSPYRFVIDYSKLPDSAALLGDTIQYFVMAMDSLGNAGGHRVSFLDAAIAPTDVALPAAIFPATGNLHFYEIGVQFQGYVSVCPSGCDYSSLSNPGGLFEQVNNGFLSDSLRVGIAGDLDESGAVMLNRWSSFPPDTAYPLAIYPVGQARTITGIGPDVILEFGGVNQLTIDGSLNGLGQDRSLKFYSSPDSLTSYQLMFNGQDDTVGYKNIVLQNLLLEGSFPEDHFGGILFSNFLLDIDVLPGQGLVVRNNHITGFETGIMLFTFGDRPFEQVKILNNIIGDSAAAFVPMAGSGVEMVLANDVEIVGNRIAHFYSEDSNPLGLRLFAMDGLLVEGNRIHDLVFDDFFGEGSAVGMAMMAVQNVRVVNNLVYGLRSNSSDLAFEMSAALNIVNGFNIDIDHNSFLQLKEEMGLNDDYWMANLVLSAVENVRLRNNLFQMLATDSAGPANAGFVNLYFDFLINPLLACSGNQFYHNNLLNAIAWIDGLVLDSIDDWKAAVPEDVTARFARPQFVDSLIFKQYNPLQSLAIAGITQDISGRTRLSPLTAAGAFEGVRAGSWSEVAATTDWQQATNWEEERVPFDTTDVTIPFVATNYPVLTGPATARNITNLATITIPSATKLSFTGNLVNEGLISGQGTLEASGSAAQSIANTVNGDGISIDSFVHSGSATVTLSGTEKLRIGKRYLSTTNQALNANGKLVFRSTAMNTAVHESGPINGNVTIERFIPAKAARKSIFLGSAVTSRIDTAWQQQIHITGAGTGGAECGAANVNGFDVSITRNPSMFVYNDGNATAQKWQSVANTNATNLVPGTGYRVVVRGPRSQGCGLLGGTPMPQDSVTLSATGLLNQASTDLNFNDSTYHLTANPYQATLNFDNTSFAAARNTGKVANSYWTYDPRNPNGVYSVYNGGVMTNATGYTNPSWIAPGQAFFVQRLHKNDTVFAGFYQPTYKVADRQAGLFRTSNNRGWDKLMRLSLKAADSIHLDETIIRFAGNNSSGNVAVTKDQLGALDAAQISQGAQSLASKKAGQWQSIQTRPLPTMAGDTVALRLTSNVSGNYQLIITEAEEMAGVEVLLRDKQLGTQQLIGLNQPVSISTSTTNPASQGADRFELIFRSSATLASKFMTVKASRNAASARNEVIFTAQEDGTTQRYQLEASANGGQSFEAVQNATTTGSRQAGIFSYQLNDERAITTNQTTHYRIKSTGNSTTYSQIVKVDAEGKQMMSVRAFPNPVTDVMNIQLSGQATASQTIEIRLLDAQGRVVAQTRMGSGSQASIATKQLAAGRYQLQAIAAGEIIHTQSIIKQ